MPSWNPRAARSDRGRHPDLDDNGDLKPDAFLEPGRRDFYRMMADPGQRSAFYYRLGQWQSQLPQHIQQAVGGQSYNGYGTNPDAYDGYRQYLQEVEQMRGYDSGRITDSDVEAMDMAEYEKYFDPNQGGRPREGVVYEPNARGVNLRGRDGIDPYSQAEWGNR